MSTTVQIGSTVTPTCGGMRNIATQEQLTFKGEQLFSEGIVTGGRVSEGFSNLYTLGLPISPISPLSGSGLPEKEIVQPINILVGILISGFINPFTATPKADKKFMLDHIDAGDQILAFVKPITGNISFDNDIFTCKNNELDIISASSNLDDCKNDFKDEVLFIYNAYGKEEDSNLSEGAKELKKKILEYVGK